MLFFNWTRVNAQMFLKILNNESRGQRTVNISKNTASVSLKFCLKCLHEIRQLNGKFGNQ